MPAATSTQSAVTPQHAADQPAHATTSSSLVVESAQQRPAVDEDAVYAAIANELESGAIDKGLWTRLFAECDGDESKTKAAYIRQRANQLLAKNGPTDSQGNSESSPTISPIESELSGDSEVPNAPAYSTSSAKYRNVLMAVVVAFIVGGASLYWVGGKTGFSNSDTAIQPQGEKASKLDVSDFESFLKERTTSPPGEKAKPPHPPTWDSLFTESEYAEHLAKERGFNIEGARKAGYKDEEIIKYILQSDAPVASPTPRLLSDEEVWGKKKAVKPANPFDQFDAPEATTPPPGKKTLKRGFHFDANGNAIAPRKVPGKGKACETDGECSATLYCSQGKCSPREKRGKYCKRDTDCAEYLYCVSGICR